jgi:hypothetical protein
MRLAASQPISVAFAGRRRRARSRESLPDWAWGLGLGVVALLVVGGILLVGNVTGGSGGQCDEPLPPIGESAAVSAEAFQQEDAALGQVISLLQRGDVAAAESAFYGPTHNFTHNVDPMVREKDEELAKQLCRAVIELEEDLARRVPPFEVTVKMQRVRELLRDSAEALGYPRPE